MAGYDAAAMSASLPATELTALLGEGTEFEGKLHFEGRVRIDGAFRGEIRSDDVLVIGLDYDREAIRHRYNHRRRLGG